jgi:hypothetical protein
MVRVYHQILEQLILYRFIRNRFSADGLQGNIIRELHDGASKDNDVFSLDAKK